MNLIDELDHHEYSLTHRAGLLPAIPDVHPSEVFSHKDAGHHLLCTRTAYPTGNHLVVVDPVP